jgi:hypothetical protein
MLLSHYAIKLLNGVFVFSFGLVTLWLFLRSLSSHKVRRSSPSKRAEFFLRITREGIPFLNIPIEKNHYLIGRAPECDIILKGSGMALKMGEIRAENGVCAFRSFVDNCASVNNGPIGREERPLLPGHGIRLYDYLLEIQRSRV